MPNARHERLESDLKAMQALQKASTIIEFENTGDPPDRYTLIFRGTGVARSSSSQDKLDRIQLHRCDLRLPYSYPDRPPDIRWLTPIFHPNVSFSGFISLRDIGLPWERKLTLDVVCERLWDVARLAYLDLEKATNYSARDWFQEENHGIEVPLDGRPLRNKLSGETSNVVRYRRRGDRKIELPGAEVSDVFYIGEDTPTPVLPGNRDWEGDDVLYIGDE